MSRERKYRVWDTQLKKMYHFAFSISANGDVTDVGWRSKWDDTKPMPELILMDYTGLKDSEGKEIYEGDIVELHNKTSPVVWNHDCWGLDGYDNGEYYNNDRVGCWEDVKIIGNIYQYKGGEECTHPLR